ncbi:hypothetical protein DBR40_19995 [Pedobacter sp. KBW01]|uniref:transglycosylase SLT domain-containing protein n=1 Tax=Pedobacter sp. KBW01 TaxID=2153364 RepID=UPI000F5A97F9|nr:transglycosylase SLT domain-containing protein [Pedobacter sp. KBW01]RQO68526.1 hypothetical protein DBR40_19995 [Pedobacter sp. KBW01]
MQIKTKYLALVTLHSRNSTAFFQGLNAVCERLGFPVEWLADCIYSESEYNPSARNKLTNASGLIQFMPKTAISLGTTVEKIRGMTNVQQLPYVEAYFKMQIKSFGKPKDALDVYLLIFYPVWVGKPDSALASQAAFSKNSYIDLNKDGKLTKGEFRTWFNKRVAGGPTETLKK